MKKVLEEKCGGERGGDSTDDGERKCSCTNETCSKKREFSNTQATFSGQLEEYDPRFPWGKEGGDGGENKVIEGSLQGKMTVYIIQSLNLKISFSSSGKEGLRPKTGM